MSKNLRFRQCECCGNYFSVPSNMDINKVLYCSAVCRTRFEQCCVCGNYFVSEEGFALTDDEQDALPICSQECADIYYENRR